MILSDMGKWILSAIAFRGSFDLSGPPQGGARSLEHVKITRFVLQAPLVVPTVTVTKTETVGIIATPVVHDLPYTTPTHQAPPRPTLDAYHYPSSSHGFEASPSSTIVTLLSWAQWLSEDRFSLAQLLLALFCTPIPWLAGLFMKKAMIRFAHQVIDHHEDQKETRRIDRIGIHCSCFIGKCLFPETFGYGPPEKPLSFRRMWEAVWAELLRPLILGIGQGLLRMSIAMRDRLGDGLTSAGRVILKALGWSTDRLPGILETLFKANGSIRMMVIRGIIGLSFQLFDWLVLSIWHATRKARFEREYNAYVDGYDYNVERKRAYYFANTESLEDAVQRIMDYDDLSKRFDELQLNFEEVTQEAIANLANKALSYRNSIIELIKIVNWTRCTVAQMMNYRHNEKQGRNPNGPSARFPYMTSQLKFVPIAQNNLHFDIMEYTTARNHICGADIRFPSNTYFENRCKDEAVYIAHLMENNLVGSYDVFKEDAIALKRNYPGILLPPYNPHEDPINIRNQRLKPVLKSELRFKEQIEDFAVEGKLLQYGQEQPKRTVNFGPDEVRLITPRPQRMIADFDHLG
ncbi:Nn.00g035420.m01.CDS01 [Neocucurbitaria sp. VM-36]